MQIEPIRNEKQAQMINYNRDFATYVKNKQARPTHRRCTVQMETLSACNGILSSKSTKPFISKMI